MDYFSDENRAYYLGKKNEAQSCRTWDEADAFIKSIEEDKRISDFSYENLKRHAINAAYEALTRNYKQ